MAFHGAVRQRARSARLVSGAGDIRHHYLADNPAVLADPAHAPKTLSLEHLHRPIVQERRRHRATLYILGIALHRSAAETADFPDRALERGGRDTLAAIGPVDEEAGDPPVGKRRQPFVIGTPMLDAWKLLRRPELAPADAVRPVIDEGGVGGALPDTRFLLGSILRRGLATPHALGVD